MLDSWQSLEDSAIYVNFSLPEIYKILLDEIFSTNVPAQIQKTLDIYLIDSKTSKLVHLININDKSIINFY